MWQTEVLGVFLVAIGVLHSAAGIALWWPVLREVVSAGIVGSVSFEHPRRMGMFWYFWSGFIWIVLGQVCWQVGSSGRIDTHLIAAELLAYSVAGAILMPKSGFWIIIACTVVVLWIGLSG